MRVRKRKGLRFSRFALLMVVFKWHHSSEGVNLKGLGVWLKGPTVRTRTWLTVSETPQARKEQAKKQNQTKIPLPIESCPVSGAGAGWTMWVLDLGLGFEPCPAGPPGPIPGPPGIIIIIVSRPPWLPGLPIMPWGRCTWPISALGAGA